MTMRKGAALVGLLVLVTAGHGQAKEAPPPTVPCGDIIGHARGGREAGYRIVLGIVSVPPAYLPQVVATRAPGWPYWRKAGLVIRAGSTRVSLRIPRSWRTRAAITWGSSGTVSALTIAPCPTPPELWNAYAGGFYTRTRSECVPVTFSVGRRSETVRFGVGGRCPPG